MIDWQTFVMFFAAALTLALIPGPGMLYVLARSLKGGRREGILSTLGTGLAGLIHTLAAVFGLSAILANSALAFDIVKWLGAAYLIYLGIKTLSEQKKQLQPDPTTVTTALPPTHGTFRQGLLTELLNPKTALFFLAFIPQFVNPAGQVFLQFVLLGSLTTLLTSGADLVVALAAGPLSGLLRRQKRLERVQQTTSGSLLIGLGIYVIAER